MARKTTVHVRAVKPAERDERRTTAVASGGGANVVREALDAFRDLGPREQAQASLPRSESNTRRHLEETGLIYDSAPVGLCVLDRDLRFVRINERLAEINGVPAADHVGRTVREVLPALADAVEPALGQVIATGTAAHDVEVSGETPARPGLRQTRIESWLPLRDADGAVVGINIAVREITDARDTPQAQARARTLAKLVETCVDFIGVVGLDAQAIYLNRAAQSLVGLAGDEAVAGSRIEDYLFSEDLPFVRGTILPTVMERGRWAGDFRFRHIVTGESIDVHWDMARIDDPDSDAPVQLAIVIRDIRTEKAVATALAEANRRKDEFLAMLGHELRNPMAPIRNAVDVLHLIQAERDPRIDWALGVLDRQAAHMSRLLDDLLDVSRIVRRQLKLVRSPVALRGLVQQAVDAVLPVTTERRHRMVVDLPDPGIEVDGDPVRLSQILLNLLSNAAAYTQEGGEIRIASRFQDGEVVVTVRDNGPGIPPDRLASLFGPVFDPFAREECGDLTNPGGLGLGITISRRLAELHGGRLEASSDWPRPGSEFRLRLPRLIGPVRASPVPDTGPDTGPDTRPAAETSALKVLVVDDNPDVAAALAMLLEVLGHQVRTATSGAEALEIAERECPRVALLDIALPDMDGMELARRLRARYPDRDRLLLVALSGYGHDEARTRSLAAGFDQYLVKPVERRTLQVLLADVR